MLSGSQALRLSRLSRQALDNTQGPRIQCFLRKAIRKTNASDNPKKAPKNVPHSNLNSASYEYLAAPELRTSHKRKRPNPPSPEDSMSDDHVSDPIENMDSQESDAGSDVDWSMNLGRPTRPKRKRRQDGMIRHPVDNTEVIELSD